EEGLLLLRQAEAEVSRGLDHARAADKIAAAKERDEGPTEEVREPRPRHASRPGGSADHRLSARGVRAARRVARQTRQGQSEQGFSAPSITTTSTAPREASSLRPSCSCSAVNSGGASGSIGGPGTPGG